MFLYLRVGVGYPTGGVQGRSAGVPRSTLKPPGYRSNSSRKSRKKV